jgi:hypothetical protein
LLGLISATPADAEPALRLAPQEGLLLLANGQILSGKITQAGDHYFVALPEGEIRLKSSEVELFCRDLEEGYRRKRAVLSGTEAQDHLNLAEWCIRHGLIGYAAKELSDALAVDPFHPKIPLLERRLQLAMKPQEKGGATAAAGGQGPSNDDLDRLVRGMPTGTVDMFTHTIQPLLLNNCTAAGCHGPGTANAFSLQRIPLGRTPNRRLTQRNLYSTLQQINSSDPVSSPLLVKPIVEHGPAKTAIFNSHEAGQYRQLAAWVHRVAGSTPAPSAEADQRRAEPLLQNMAAPMARRDEPALSTSDKSAADKSMADKPAAGQTGDAPPAVSAAKSTPKPDAGDKAKESFVPVDAFDAEIFNRRFLPAK